MSVHAGNLLRMLGDPELRKRLSAEQIARIERTIEAIQQAPDAVLVNEEKYDASDMEPVDHAESPPSKK